MITTSVLLSALASPHAWRDYAMLLTVGNLPPLEIALTRERPEECRRVELATVVISARGDEPSTVELKTGSRPW